MTPFLLSLLVFPGLGQALSRRPWRALGFGATTLALFALLLERIHSETMRLLPVADPEAILDPMLPFRLSAEIHRANASFLGWITAGLVVVWAASAADAWTASRAPRKAGDGTS
jgi:hypothetical protein